MTHQLLCAENMRTRLSPLFKSTNEKVKIKATDIVLGDLSDELKERLKKQIPNDPSKTMGQLVLSLFNT